jgi:hypothetical protein
MTDVAGAGLVRGFLEDDRLDPPSCCIVKSHDRRMVPRFPSMARRRASA